LGGIEFAVDYFFPIVAQPISRAVRLEARGGKESPSRWQDQRGGIREGEETDAQGAVINTLEANGAVGRDGIQIRCLQLAALCQRCGWRKLLLSNISLKG